MSDQAVKGFILNEIESGSYPAGSRLPTERALCEMLSVGRGVVRTALNALESEGRIVRIAGSGTYVKDTGRRETSLGEVSSPIQIMDARLAFEPTLIRLVVTNATASDFRNMDECIAAGAAAETIDQFEHWDAEFHEAIAAATGNPVMIAAYKLVTEARNTGEWGALKRRTLTDKARADYQQHHERILAALRQRDIDEGEAALREHLVAIRTAMLGH